MKETVKTSRVAGYLEAMYRALNARYFGGELEEPIITIQSTPRAYAHVTVGKVWHRLDGREQREVNIGAGTLDRPIENVVASLLHELVHVQNMQLGIKDCSLCLVPHLEGGYDYIIQNYPKIAELARRSAPEGPAPGQPGEEAR